jgi:membrane protease YdiL (CAAX protease family)
MANDRQYETDDAGPDVTPRRSPDSGEGSWTRVLGLYFGAFAVFMVMSGVFYTLVDQQEAVIAAQFIGILLPAVAYRLLEGEGRAQWPALDRLGLGPGALALLVVATVTLGLAANALMGMTVELIPALQDTAEQYRESLNSLILEAEGLDRILGVTAVCLVAPLCEETLFRGALLSETRLVTGTVGAVAANGLMFSMFHLNPMAVLPLAIVGAFLAHVIVLSGSLWAAILAHAIFNTFNAVVLPEIAPNIEATDVPPVELFDGALVLGAIPQFVLAVIFFGGIGAASWWGLVQVQTRNDDSRDEC